VRERSRKKENKEFNEALKKRNSISTILMPKKAENFHAKMSVNKNNFVGNKIKLIITIILIANAKLLHALKCVCNVNDCELIKADECPGRGVLVWDPCR
jgi:hypothetical protein